MDRRAWPRPSERRDTEQEEADRVTASLAGLAMALFLVVAGLFLVHRLHTKAQVEDCLMARHAHCDQFITEN